MKKVCSCMKRFEACLRGGESGSKLDDVPSSVVDVKRITASSASRRRAGECIFAHRTIPPRPSTIHTYNTISQYTLFTLS